MSLANTHRRILFEHAKHAAIPNSSVVRISNNSTCTKYLFQQKVWEPFFGIDNNNTKGHGLGLSFARQSTCMYQGNITLTSQQGTGSTFTITLPQRNDL